MSTKKEAETKTEAELFSLLKDSPEHLQVQILVNMAKGGRWDLLNADLKPGVKEKVISECRKQGIRTEQQQ